MSNQQTSNNTDLEFLKERDKTIQDYQDKMPEYTKTPEAYRQLAYRVKNPFRGI